MAEILAFPGMEGVMSRNSWRNSSFLERMRQAEDPVADACVHLWHRQPEHRLPSSDLLDSIVQLRRNVPAYQTFYERTFVVPKWVDWDRMEAGRSHIRRNMITGGLVLLTGSLVESYTSPFGIKALVRTGRLRKDVVRRLYETADFAQSIGLHDGPHPGDETHAAILRVRLLHAFVRYHIQHQSDDWQDAWGRPVNQQDMAWTLCMFSHTLTRGLEALGVPFSIAEHNSYHHLWQYVGYLIGVDPGFATDNADQESELYTKLAACHPAPDEDSRELAHNLLGSMAGRPPFFLPRNTFHALSRKIIGDAQANALLLEEPTWTSRLLIDSLGRANTSLNFAYNRMPFWGVAAEGIGTQLTRAIMQLGLQGKPADYGFKKR